MLAEPAAKRIPIEVACLRTLAGFPVEAKSKMSSSGLAYRPEIDGLRAIAVLLVVLYHAGVGPSLGFAGVDVFFVISGYLITSLLLREWNEWGRIDLPAFYARRARRILPAAVAVVLATLWACSIFLAPGDLMRATDSAAAAAVFGANFFFQASTGGYFDPRSEEMPLLHLWSLSVEEQFYLIWPALLILVLRYWPRKFVLILGGLGLASLLLAEGLMRTNPEAAFYQMPARFWELAAGGLIAAFPARKALPEWSAGAGVLLILVASNSAFGHFPGLGALPIVLGSTILLWAVHGGGNLGLTGRWLRSPPMRGIGLISYSLYLWHWPLLALYQATTIGEGSTAVRVSLCGLAALLAVVSYRYVEQPFRRAQDPRRRALGLGMMVSLTIASGALAWSYRLESIEASRPVDNPFAIRTERDLPVDWRRCHYQVGSTLFPRGGCESSPGRPPTIAVWGDSMAMAWKPFAWQLAKTHGVSAIAYSRDACPPLVGYLAPENLPGQVKCRDFNTQVVEQLAGIDTLFLVMRMGQLEPAAADSRLPLLVKTLAHASPRVGRVVIVGPTPEMADSVPKCIRTGNLGDCAITRSRFDAIAAPQIAALRVEANKFENVDVLDVSDYFCTTTTCPPTKGGFALYWDDHHVSATAATRLALWYSSTPQGQGKLAVEPVQPTHGRLQF